MSYHSYLVLFTYLSALNLFSAFKNCRDSIEMIIQCLKSIFIFSSILIYFLISFCLFFWSTTNKENDNDSTTISREIIWNQFAAILPIMTGGFDFGEGESTNTQITGQVVFVYIMTILMLNLLVGILSEKLGEIMSKRVISSYKLLLGVCIETETLRRLFQISNFMCEEKPTEGVHLVYATRIEG